jgi:hypothetical protein
MADFPWPVVSVAEGSQSDAFEDSMTALLAAVAAFSEAEVWATG